MSFRTAFTGFRNEAASATFRSRPTGGAGGAAGAGRRAYTQGGMYQGPSAFRKWAVRLGDSPATRALSGQRGVMGTLIHSSRSAASPPAHRREKSQGRGKNGRSGPSRPYVPHELSLTSSALTIAFPAAYFTGAVFPPKIVLLLYPRYAPPPPAGDSPQGKALMGETEKDLQKLWIVARLRTREGWYETRPYARFDPDKIHNSLTAGSLRGPGKLAVPPIVFSKDDESEAIAVLHLGRALCGHDGIIHGGIISTVFDESLARNALLNLPTHIGVTANLNVNYRSPLHADQFVVVRTKLDSVNGRKVMVSGTMETLEGEKIAEATALFVEPKWANFLQSSGVTAALGRPLPSSSPATTPAVYASKAN